jgi:hypothetical protein
MILRGLADEFKVDGRLWVRSKICPKSVQNPQGLTGDWMANAPKSKLVRLAQSATLSNRTRRKLIRSQLVVFQLLPNVGRNISYWVLR